MATYQSLLAKVGQDLSLYVDGISWQIIFVKMMVVNYATFESYA